MKSSAVASGDTRSQGAQGGDRPAPTGPRQRALLVEDDADQRELLIRLLGRSGYLVDAVATAAEALAVPASAGQPDLRSGRPDGAPPAEGEDRGLGVIVLDLRLPDLNGWDLLEQLRARHPGCPVIVSSVLDVEDYPDADGVLPKPVTAAALRRVLGELAQPGAPA